MAQQQTKPAIDKVEPVWTRVRREAEEIAQREPEIASFIYSTILQNETLEAAIVQRISDRLESPQVSGGLIRQAFEGAIDEQPALGEIFRADIAAIFDRDPATQRYIDPVLYYKGFHAIQTLSLIHI